MNTVFAPKRVAISVERYQKMVASGVLTSMDRIELIEGEMLTRAPIGSKHSATTTRLHELLVLALAGSATVVAGGPINLGEFSEPQPDLMILKRRADFYSAKIPEAPDALLVVEVSDSTLAFDQGVKRDLYAKFAVREYWIVDVNRPRIVTHLDPARSAFQATREYLLGDTVTPQAFPDLKIPLRELFV